MQQRSLQERAPENQVQIKGLQQTFVPWAQIKAQLNPFPIYLCTRLPHPRKKSSHKRTAPQALFRNSLKELTPCQEPSKRHDCRMQHAKVVSCLFLLPERQRAFLRFEYLLLSWVQRNWTRFCFTRCVLVHFCHRHKNYEARFFPDSNQYLMRSSTHSLHITLPSHLFST